MSDDHAYQAISAYGSNRNQTPNIDRLAKEGMRFDRAFVTNSICGPSRAVILTGKYSHLNGFPDNGGQAWFNGRSKPSPKLLQAAGYNTAMIGKWHLVSDPTGFDYWHILHGQGPYYNPRMKTPGGVVKHDRLHDRHHHRRGPRLAEEQARQDQAVLPHVPAQGAAPQLAAGRRGISTSTRT